MAAKIASLDGPGLKALFEEREAMMLRYEGAAMYGRLRYSADTSDLVSKQLNDAVSKAGTKVGQLLAFMEIDISHLLRSKPEHTAKRKWQRKITASTDMAPAIVPPTDGEPAK